MVDSKNMKINKKIQFFPLKILLVRIIVYFNCIYTNIKYNYMYKN